MGSHGLGSTPRSGGLDGVWVGWVATGWGPLHAVGGLDGVWVAWVATGLGPLHAVCRVGCRVTGTRRVWVAQSQVTREFGLK